MLKKEWAISITIVLFLLGLLLSIQFQIQTRLASDLSMQKTEHLIAMVKDLKDKRDNLELEINSVKDKIQTIKYSKLDTTNIIGNLESEFKNFQIINGQLDLHGPGLKIVIEKESPIIYVDIVHILNELWAAGAEAISINGHRVNFNTTISYVEDSSQTFITVNGKAIMFPIIINSIGEPNTLEKGLTLPGGIIDNLALFHAYPYIEQSEEIFIPSTTQDDYRIYSTEEKEAKKKASPK